MSDTTDVPDAMRPALEEAVAQSVETGIAWYVYELRDGRYRASSTDPAFYPAKQRAKFIHGSPAEHPNRLVNGRWWKR